ncbi:unnamed protein product [Arctia plantaginis]|uniref:Uncharacterized protein n=1 Tax=Arctia plantaginis TaxID=874455 RepID=A0A8S1BLI8_ARCPL|nr:unnamed protein product [Arctia plantaginis]
MKRGPGCGGGRRDKYVGRVTRRLLIVRARTAPSAAAPPQHLPVFCLLHSYRMQFSAQSASGAMQNIVIYGMPATATYYKSRTIQYTYLSHRKVYEDRNPLGSAAACGVERGAPAASEACGRMPEAAFLSPAARW